jgi:glucose-6-phosphate isomerase/transaldolase/glucose-6-phosphate isomerase
MDRIEAAGHPVIRLRVHDLFDLGGQFFLWEMATAIAGHQLRINPFDQPNVEAAKVLARELIGTFNAEGGLPEQQPTLSDDNLEVYGDGGAADLRGTLTSFLEGTPLSSYIALLAYVQPTSENFEQIQKWRHQLRSRTRLATTVGFGPRYLHSTGQLHKGDAGNGTFIQITGEDARDANIPDEAGSAESSLSFSTLKAAQAMGDRKALEEAGRRVIRLHIKGNLHEGLARLTELLD